VIALRGPAPLAELASAAGRQPSKHICKRSTIRKEGPSFSLPRSRLALAPRHRGIGRRLPVSNDMGCLVFPGCATSPTRRRPEERAGKRSPAAAVFDCFALDSPAEGRRIRTPRSLFTAQSVFFRGRWGAKRSKRGSSNRCSSQGGPRVRILLPPPFPYPLLSGTDRNLIDFAACLRGG